MKKYLFYFILSTILLIPLLGSAQDTSSTHRTAPPPRQELPDTTPSKYKLFRIFNLSLTWAEIGKAFPIKDKKLLSLPYGMNDYFYNVKNDYCTGFFGFGLYYKDHLGLSFIFNEIDFSVVSSDFKKYIETKYPNYFLPENFNAYSYSISTFVIRVNYKFHIKKFILEPQFQLGIHDYSSPDYQVNLKESGSNQFVEYAITSHNLKKNNFSYSLGLEFCRRIHLKDMRANLEFGIRPSYLIDPIHYEYTITETPYLMTPTINKLSVKQLNQSFTLQVYFSLLYKKTHPF